MLQLYAYRTTGEERYLEAFRKGARFWNEAFVDEKSGGTVLKTTLDGTVTAGDKAVRTKTSYHAVEHALLNALYLDLWANEQSVSLHYRLQTPGTTRLHPLPIEERPRIHQVRVNGTPHAPLDTLDGAVRVPSTPGNPIHLQIDVTTSPTTP
jgi:hypothetical protein